MRRVLPETVSCQQMAFIKKMDVIGIALVWLKIGIVTEYFHVEIKKSPGIISPPITNCCTARRKTPDIDIGRTAVSAPWWSPTNGLTRPYLLWTSGDRDD